jgi:hypothetical protein
MTINQIKQNLGEQTENLESKASRLWSEFSPHYTNLEPWQRGLVLIGLIALIAFAAYYLTHESQSQKASKKAKLEQLQEEKIIRRMELLKKLRE